MSFGAADHPRSFPRKREPRSHNRKSVLWQWVPAFAGTNGTILCPKTLGAAMSHAEAVHTLQPAAGATAALISFASGLRYSAIPDEARRS